MLRPTHLAPLAALTVVLAGCYGPEPRPFAGRGGRSLDRPPPRYGEPSRYVEPLAPGPMDPLAVPAPQPGADPGLNLDPGMVVTPPTHTPAVPGGVQTPPAPPPAPTSPAARSDVPFARRVPGQPNQVYSLKDPKRAISVEGFRPGQTVADPVTGDLFRVPY